MGQYYHIVNVDKKEYLYSHDLNDGLKLLEFGCSANGIMTALAILLADGNNRGGGDLHVEHPLIGSWAGDRIVVAGDYADKLKFIPGLSAGSNVAGHCKKYHDCAMEKAKAGGDIPNCTLYCFSGENFKNITPAIAEVMGMDGYIKEKLQNERDGVLDKKGNWIGPSYLRRRGTKEDKLNPDVIEYNNKVKYAKANGKKLCKEED